VNVGVIAKNTCDSSEGDRGWPGPTRIGQETDETAYLLPKYRDSE